MKQARDFVLFLAFLPVILFDFGCSVVIKVFLVFKMIIVRVRLKV